MSQTYRVQEFAALAGVTVKALRHYDRLGLLRPARSAAGYRLYRLSDLPRLEQIVALKSIGLPLGHVRTLLGSDALPLDETLRHQRAVLDERRRLLDRAIRALEDAERGLAAGGAPAPILQKLIKAMTMQDVDVMRRYYSDDAWPGWKHHYEDWPPEEWRAFYRDVAAVLESDPAGPEAQALADRWLRLTHVDQPPAVRTGLIKAWADRHQWPAALRRRLAEFDIERATRFIGEALWERWEAERLARERQGAPAPPRVSEARRALYRECAAILDRAPSSPEAQDIAVRWRALLDRETGNDEETRREVLDGFRRRHQWPAGMLRYMASLYEMDSATWLKVADFIEQAMPDA